MSGRRKLPPFKHPRARERPLAHLLRQSGPHRVVENVPGHGVRRFAGPKNVIVESPLPEGNKALHPSPRRARAFEISEQRDEV